jgi:hypothetical protein
MMIGLWVMMMKRVSVGARHFIQQIADVFDIPKIGAAECAAAVPAGKLKEDMPLSRTVHWF